VSKTSQSPVAEFADATANADLGMVCIMGLPATPSMPNHGDLLASRTNANHLARLAFDLIPCDKYNHCGGEGLFRITAPKQLSGWPPSLPNESQVHLEEKPHLTLATLYFPILAGKRVTDSENNSSPSFQELTTIRIP
jgi:hypothetical protein